MYEGIKKALAKHYDAECEDKYRSKDFNKAYRAFIKSAIKKYGYDLVSEKGSGYCESSGFITDNKGHYVYFNSGDYRWNNVCNDIFESVLYRTAENDKDYKGGMNHFCSLNELADKVKGLFDRKSFAY